MWWCWSWLMMGHFHPYSRGSERVDMETCPEPDSNNWCQCSASHHHCAIKKSCHTDSTMWMERWSSDCTTHMHRHMNQTSFHDVNTLRNCLHRHQSSWHDLLWLVSAGGSRWPSSATLVIQCPEPLHPPLLLQLRLSALLCSALHQRCSSSFGYRYIQHCGSMDGWLLLHLGCKFYLHLGRNKYLWSESSSCCCSCS